MLASERGKGPGPNGFQERDLDVRATTLVKGNWNYKDRGIPDRESLGGVVLPKSQEQFITVRKCAEVAAGDILTLNRVTAKHFMMGGPSGGIVSEYASFHDNDGLRFTNPGVKF